ncbi:MAG: apolipoprotein N-acyltransferase [Gammaproteobacteria bacterium]|nr:apolipoprotein N-acyltransferase [Gammaproteobacteria bacterium]
MGSSAGRTTKRVALVQGAVPQAIKWKPEQLRESMHLYYDLSRPFWKEADLVVWPETAIPAFADQLSDYLDVLREQAIALDTPLIAGLATRDQGDGHYYNSLLAIGAHEDIYHKRHLVPFGEYLPLKTLLQPLLSFLEIPMSDFSAGDAKRPLLDVGNLKAGVSICYEDTFGEEVIQALPDADFLINVSNDAWFGDSIAPHQHLQMARFRSLESGRYMLRSTNTGISAIIDHNGNVTARSPQFASDVLISKMRLYSGSTPYVITGNAAIIWICVISLAALLLAGRHTNKRPEENP